MTIVWLQGELEAQSGRKDTVAVQVRLLAAIWTEPHIQQQKVRSAIMLYVGSSHPHPPFHDILRPPLWISTASPFLNPSVPSPQALARMLEESQAKLRPVRLRGSLRSEDEDAATLKASVDRIDAVIRCVCRES
jgi:hypothetical protein